MTLFNEIVEKKILPKVNSEQAMIIYNHLKTKDANTLFLEDNIPTEYTELVLKEIKSLEAEMVSKMNGTFLLNPEEFHYDEKTGEKIIDKKAVYFVVTTETALKASMSSDLLNIDVVVTDIRIWNDGLPDKIPLWTTYKASFGDD